jgi:hypothetical protein
VATLLVAMAAAGAAAHELRPGYLELRETATDRYRALWKQPARGDLRLACTSPIWYTPPR